MNLKSDQLSTLVRSHNRDVDKTSKLISELLSKSILGKSDVENIKKDNKALKSFTKLAYILDGGKISRLAKAFGNEKSREKIINTLKSIGEEFSKNLGKIEYLESGENSYSYLISKTGKIYIKNDEMLGKGGQKEVYLAVGLDDDDDLVWASTDLALESIEKEANDLNALHKAGVSNIMPAFKESVNFGGATYVAIQDKALPVDKYAKNCSAGQMLKVMQNIAQGLADINIKAKKVFRDIKPDNILVVNNQGLIHDFGSLSKIDEVAAMENTYDYTPPECFQKGKDYKAKPSYDSFSFGVTLFQMLTKKSTFIKGDEVVPFGTFKNQSEIDEAIKQEIEKIQKSDVEKDGEIGKLKTLMSACEVEMKKKSQERPKTQEERKSLANEINKLNLLQQYYKSEIDSLSVKRTNQEKEFAIKTLNEVCKGLIVYKKPKNEDPNRKIKNPSLSDPARERLTCAWAATELDRLYKQATIKKEPTTVEAAQPQSPDQNDLTMMA